MRSVYRYPALYTLEGYTGSDFPVPGVRMSGAYKQQDTYREQNFAVLSGDWGILNFLRPSQMRTWTGAVATVATVASVIPNPVTPWIAGAAGALSAGSQAIYMARRGGSGDPPDSGTGYKPSTDAGITGTPEQKKTPWVPAVILGGAIIAALSIS